MAVHLTLHRGGLTAPDALPLLDAVPWLGCLTRAERRQIADLAERVEVQAGEAVLFEGQRSDRLFFVEHGALSVLKRADDRDRPLAVLGVGDGFGDLSFVDDLPVSASVIADQDSALWAVSRTALERRAGADLLPRLYGALGALSSRRLRQQNEALIASLEGQLALERGRMEAANLLGLIVMLLGMQQAAMVLVEQAGLSVKSTAYEWGMLLLFMTPTLLFARTSGFSWRDLGVTLGGARAAACEALAVSGVAVAALLGGAAVLRQAGVITSDTPLVSLQLLRETPFELVAYFAHASIQELGSRGVIQSAVVRFIGKERLQLALFVVSGTFAVVHLHLGLSVAALTLLGSYAFGALFQRQGTLVGVITLHFVLGMTLKLMSVL